MPIFTRTKSDGNSAATATAGRGRFAPGSEQSVDEFAVLCAGLDRIRRGYETHTRTLFDALSSEEHPGFHLSGVLDHAVDGRVMDKTLYRLELLVAQIALDPDF